MPVRRYWVELLWPAPKRDLNDFWVWFHEGKLSKEKKIREGDRVLYYEVRRHPDHLKDMAWKGAKRLFASGTVTSYREAIPEEKQLRGGKRWLFKRKVVTDVAVPSVHGIGLADLRRLRGKGWTMAGFELDSEAEFKVLEDELRRRRDGLNAATQAPSAPPSAYGWQKFKPGLLLSIVPANSPPDPAAVAAQQERAHNAHITLLNSFAAALQNAGVETMWNAHCDMTVNIEGVRWLFEVKSCHEGNLLTQVRQGIAQLYEYRFRYCAGQPNAQLCLVLQIAPAAELGWIVRYLEQDRGIHVTWPTPEGFRSLDGSPTAFFQPRKTETQGTL